MDRHTNASLSPHEMASLRMLNFDSRQPIPATHRALLLAMKLIELNAGQLVVTAVGRQRLMAAGAGEQSPDSRSVRA